MKKLRFHKGLRLNDGQTKPVSLTLIFSKPMPGPVGRRFIDWDTLMRARFIREGEALERALFEVLPGGTYEMLLSQMHNRKAKLHVTSFAEPKTTYSFTKESSECQVRKRKARKRKPPKPTARRSQRPLVK